MPYLGWLTYGGVEVLNDARTAGYAAAACLDAVTVPDADGLLAWLGSTGRGPYAYGDRPADDPAPWFDPADPAGSNAFLGLIGVSIDGISSSPVSASVTEAVGGEGGTPGPAVAGPREMLCKAVLIATDSTGVEAGRAWLAAVLAGRPPTGAATSADQAALTAGVLPPRWGAPPRPGGLAAPLQLLATDTADARPDDARTLYDVVLTDGPDITAVHALPPTDEAPAPVAVELQWTFTAGLPWLWGAPVELASTGLMQWPHAYGTDPSPWVDEDTTLPVRWVMQRDMTGPLPDRGTDPAAAPCGGGSGCPGVGTLPRPVPVLDACAATMPLVPSWGILGDLANPADEASRLPGMLLHAPIVVIDAGGGPMRRASIRIGRRLPGGYHDPAGRLLRWELNVPYIPAGGRCILDGRTRTAVTHCAATGTPGQAIDAPAPVRHYTPAVYGLRSTPVVWPVFPGGEDLRFTAHAEDNFTAGNARVTLFAAARQALA